MNDATPLDDYVNKPDPAFAWKHIKTYLSLTHTNYILNMTSEKWMDSRIIEIKRRFFDEIIFFLRFILITINMLALYGYYRS
jgi:hypothetical protein